MTRYLTLLSVFALAGCLEPTTLTDDTDLEEDSDTDIVEEDLNRGGSLYVEPVVVNWQWTTVTDDSVCVSIEIENLGPDIEGYQLTLATDEYVETLTRFGGAGVTADREPSTLMIDNPNMPIIQGEADEVIVCGSPRFEITKVLEVELTYPEEPPDPPDRIAGSIIDPLEILLLGYEQNGRANNGDCMDLIVKNVSEHSFERFYLDVTFPDPVEIKLFSGLAANSTDNSSKVRLWPGPGDMPLHPYDEITGQLCIDKAQHPGSMRANDVEIVIWP